MPRYRLRQVRPAARAAVGGRELRPDPQAHAHFAGDVHARRGAGRRAPGHAAAQRRCADTDGGLPRAARARIPTLPRSRCWRWCLATTPTGRLHKQLTEKQLALQRLCLCLVAGRPGGAFLGAELAPGQDVDKARDALLAMGESIAAQPITRRRTEARPTHGSTAGSRPSPIPRTWAWRCPRPCHGRLAAVLPGTRPGPQLTLADVQRVAEAYLRARQPHARHVPVHRSRSARRPRPRPTWPPRCRPSSRRPPWPRWPTFDATPGPHRRAHAALRGRRAEGRGAVQADARRRGAGGAEPALRRRDEPVRPGGGMPMLAARPARQGHAPSSSRQQVQDRLDALKTEVRVQAAPGASTVG